MSRAARRRAERRGQIGERAASLWLGLKGYRVLARQVRTGVGEIDIVARRADVVAFVEVKTRARYDQAVEAVTPGARRRIEAAARQWMAGNPAYARFAGRFDIIAIRPWRLPVHLRDAWRPDFAKELR